MTSQVPSVKDIKCHPSRTALDQYSKVGPTMRSDSDSHDELSADEGLITLVYEVEQEPTASRNRTPARLEFSNMPAHPFVISGTAGAGAQVSSTFPYEAFEEEDSIPLQDRQPTEADKQASLDKLPIPPSPAFLTSSRFNEVVDCNLHPKHMATALGEHNANLDRPTETAVEGQPFSLFATVKNAFRMSTAQPWESDLAQSGAGAHWLKQHPYELEHNNMVGQNEKAPTATGRLHSTRRGRDAYLQRRSSIYHSTLGAAPSGSVRASSPAHDGEHHNPTDEVHDISIGLYGGMGSHAYDCEPPLALPRGASMAQNSSESSAHDSSTIGNIYQHYVGSNAVLAPHENNGANALPTQSAAGQEYFEKRDDDQSSSASTPSSDGSGDSPWVLEKSGRICKFSLEPRGESPSMALPKLPLKAKPGFASIVSGGTPQFSYGGTRQFLDLTESNLDGGKSALSRSACHTDLQYGMRRPGRPQQESTNPFRRSRGPQILGAASHGAYGYRDGMNQATMWPDREPLEREVSKALRRASGLSAYSDGSISSSILFDQYEQRKLYNSGTGDIGLAKPYHFETTPPSGYGESDNVVSAKGHGFYEQAAIAPDWVSARHQNVVRVPIGQGDSFPASPPTSPRQGRGRASNNQRYQAYVEDDVGDWETVGESVFGTDLNGSRDTRLFGGTINQTGSSIANYSDDGTTNSNVPEFDSYGSTDRIAQHPGTINFFGDYRQRDLKKTKTPMFVPVFREHKVNGYLADSNRTKPRPAHFLSLKPQPALAKSHANPFKSVPPVIKTAGPERSLYTAGRRTQGTNRTPVPLKDFSLSTEFDGQPHAVQFSQPPASSSASKRVSANFNWSNASGGFGQAINATTPKPFRLNIPIHYQSSQHAMEVALETAKLELNDPGHGVSSASEVQGKIIYGDSPEAIKNTRRTSLMEAKYQKTVAQGLPGALYQGIRARPESREVNGSADRKPSAKSPGRKNGTKDYPTNGLRPLSLVATHLQPPSPKDNESDLTEQARPYGFTYRSPGAPVISDEWKQLYTPTQLANMEEHARQHLGSREPPTGGFISREDPWRVHLYEAPRLHPSPRQVDRLPGAAKRKTNISIAAFALCNLCPPLLILFATGHLDQLMAAMTSTEFTAFADKQKKWAKVATVLWLLATATILVMVLATELKHPAVDPSLASSML